MNLSLTALLLIAIAITLYFLIKCRQEYRQLRKVRLDILQCSQDMYQTMAVGLYERFKQGEGRQEGKKENPLEFENFVARVMVNYYGGQAFVTGGSGDYGVDIEHNQQNGKYLGQVKCYAPDHLVPYEPIAIIHSQMNRQQAKGGYVVTTSDFTVHARKYAEGLNIMLINGPQLVALWLKGLEKAAKPYHYQKNKSESA
ncbi:MAG: restriction endonuclease [Syntrophomonadaceae bacterium]|jgi:restriction system protein|nr:restriction endonuclease [Syntrophomonadaceae bacterium]